MIPQIIHYTWFSNDPMPSIVVDCINSWKKHMPEYEFIHWDMNRINKIDSIFLKQAISVKKWAFAADFIRLYAVYNFGGIYLDTDVYVYKSFNPLLKDKSFIGMENSIHIEGRKTDIYLTSHCFGAEKNDLFVGKCLSYYNRPFITSKERTLPTSLKYNMTIIPFIQSEIAQEMGYNSKPSAAKNPQYLDDKLVIYPANYFDCTKITRNSYCKHLALGSWREKYAKDIKYNIMYKIKWRIIALIQFFLKKFNYMIIELE